MTATVGVNDRSASRNELAAALRSLDLDMVEVEGVLERIGERSLGVLLYGSRARGDFLPSSDFDLLRLTTDTTIPTFKVGRASVSSYTKGQLLSADGTLFGTHLKRDGRILVDPNGYLASFLELVVPADAEELLRRVQRYSVLLDLPEPEKEAHRSGLVRLARYLLRTAVYAQAMKDGKACFSVRELATRFADEDLATLLASDPAVTGPPTLSLLEELTDRLENVVGQFPRNRYQTLQALAVALWDSDRNLAALAIRAGDEEEVDSLDYSDLPKVLL